MEPSINIGLTYTGTDEKHNNYVKWLANDEQINIIILSAGIDTRVIKELDGIVLSGGVDVHPNYYKPGNIQYPNAPENFNVERDEFEAAVCEISKQQEIPLLAICRGMQLVNCLSGGTLIQDLGHAGNSIHRFEQSDKQHLIHIVPGSLLHEITGAVHTSANSAHHQAIDTLGIGLMINARSDDGIIEGIEWQEKAGRPFFLGIQWHPERMYKLGLAGYPAANNIREHFIKEVTLSKQNL